MSLICTIFTFKNTSRFRGHYILVKDLNIYKSVQYAKEKYGADIDNSYPYTLSDFKLMCKWKPCLYGECKDSIFTGKHIIELRKLKCLEVVTLREDKNEFKT